MIKGHVLVVDDEASVRDVVKKYLERDGYLVSVAASGIEASRILEKERDDLDLVLLDVMLPGQDGLSLLKELRSNSLLPVIMLSARSAEFDRVRGLDLGADDYIPKPFSPSEVVSRVRAVLRRIAKPEAQAPAEKALTLGQITLDPTERRVIVDQEQCELTAKEFELLWFFMRHPKQVFSREQLLDQVWGVSEFIDASTVTVHIHRLRDKIARGVNKAARLATVWGVGYKLALED